VIAILAEFRQGGGEQTGAAKNGATELDSGADADSEIEPAQNPYGGDPSLFPEKRDNKNRQKNQAQRETEKGQEREQKSQPKPLPFLFELSSKKF
jgi:hypothetical protein